MPKYYVRTGTLREVVDAESEDEAVRQALRRTQGCGYTLGFIFSVSQRGWDEKFEHDDTMVHDTRKLLERLGFSYRILGP